MRKSTVVFFCFLFIFSANSQTPAIIGIDCDGGEQGKGRIFTIDGNFNSTNTEHEFEYVEGRFEFNFDNLCLANNGKYYGIHSLTDRCRSVIFEYAIASNSYKIVYEFDFGNIHLLYGGLVKGPNGFLYGVIKSSSLYQYGAIYRFNPQNNGSNIVHVFDSLNQQPNSTPIIAKNNKLYGSTQGGINGPSPARDGTLYEYDIQNNIFSSLYTFNSWYRSENSRLVEGSDSTIYGVREGSWPYYGRLYKYNYNSNTFAKIYEFDVRTNYPQTDFNNLIFLNEHLYISAYSGNLFNNQLSNPAIYKVDVSQSTVSVVDRFDFVDSIHGGFPLGQIQLNANKELIGTMYNGGPDNNGTIFKIDTNLSTVAIKSPFSKAERMFKPSGQLIHKNDSTFIGFTTNAPEQTNSSSFINEYSHGLGSIYEYNPDKDSIKSKIQFGKSDLGYLPTGSIVKTPTDDYYIVTQRGGKYFSGTILHYDLINDSLHKIHDFDSSVAIQINSVVLLNNSTLLGIGSKDTVNKIVEYNLLTDSFKVVYELPYKSSKNHSAVFNRIYHASNGKIYGTNKLNSSGNNGVIYEYDPVSNSSRVVYSYIKDKLSEISPEFVELNQKLYCLYQNRNSPYSGILEYDLLTDSIRLFPKQNNNSFFIDSRSSLSAHSNGKLYGLARKSGVHVFEFDLNANQGNRYTLKSQISYDGVHRQYASGPFLEAGNKKFYFKINEPPFGVSYSDTTQLIEYDVVNDNARTIYRKETKSNCYAINNFILLNSTVTNIDKVQTQEFKIYPNPTNSLIHIKGIESIDRLEVHSVTGQLVGVFRNSSNTIDVSNLEPGIYFLKIYTEDTAIIKKFIKQ